MRTLRLLPLLLLPLATTGCVVAAEVGPPAYGYYYGRPAPRYYYAPAPRYYGYHRPHYHRHHHHYRRW